METPSTAIMPLFVIVNHKAHVIASCRIDSPMIAMETILNAFPWRHTDELTLYNTQNYDASTLQAIIDNLINKGGYHLYNSITL